MVFVHGLGSNGYIRFTDALASVLPEAGVALVRGNLRDSEMLGIDESPQIAEVRKGGGAYHRFEDSVLDLESWMSEAERRGYGRIVLFGHSLGSLKATHYLFRTGDPRVKGLVLASTADLVAMHEGRYTKQELADFLATARRLVAEGRGADLMPPECGMGLLFQPVSAEAYLDRFDEPASWDVMDLYDRGSERAFEALRNVSVPILALFGTTQETVPFDRLDTVFDLFNVRPRGRLLSSATCSRARTISIVASGTRSPPPLWRGCARSVASGSRGPGQRRRRPSLDLVLRVPAVGDEHVPRTVGDHQGRTYLHRDCLGRYTARPEHG